MINIKLQEIGTSRHLSVQGRIDMANALEFEDILMENLNNTDKLELDLAGLTFIDSSGIYSLASVIQFVNKNNICFEIINVPEAISEIFDVIGVYELLNKKSNP